MSFICPRGHHSVSDDYCSVCGVRNPGSPVMAGIRTAQHGSGESVCLVCGVQLRSDVLVKVGGDAAGCEPEEAWRLASFG